MGNPFTKTSHKGVLSRHAANVFYQTAFRSFIELNTGHGPLFIKRHGAADLISISPTPPNSYRLF